MKFWIMAVVILLMIPAIFELGSILLSILVSPLTVVVSLAVLCTLVFAARS